MLKKIIKMFVLPGILLSLIIAGCTINSVNEDLQNEEEELSISSDHSQPMKVLSNKRFISLKQTYTHVSAWNGYLYCLASGPNEYLNTSKGWGANHRLHVRKISGTTLYSSKFQYEFKNIWTHMYAYDDYLIMYAKNNYDSDGNNFHLYYINNDGSISLKNKYRYRSGWDDIKIFNMYVDWTMGSNPPSTDVVFLKDEGNEVNFKHSTINYYKGVHSIYTNREKIFDSGFTSMAQAAGESSKFILFYKKFAGGDNFYELDKAQLFRFDSLKNPKPLKRRLPIYLSDIHCPTGIRSSNIPFAYRFFYVKQGSAFEDKSHLKEYADYNLTKHIRSYLTRDDDIGWDNITSNENFLIVHRSSQLYKNKRNFMIALIK